ncbi:MAG: thrombospondin type 3 repeat-containing protein [Saprospiraceae bacterium]|nr:thrombospondin type 3 repeat-containing protein [Saprospiraceae bacterium]
MSLRILKQHTGRKVMMFRPQIFAGITYLLCVCALPVIAMEPWTADVSVTPDHVYADGIQEATIVATQILDLDGLPVPEGTVVTISTSRGTIEGGTPNPVAGYRDFVVENNSVVATYRSEDLALAPNQTSIAGISLYSVRDDGRPLRLVQTALVTLVGKSAAVLSFTPDHVYADGMQTASIVITDILDADGNPVPDGEVCALRANRGVIEGGLPNPAGNGYQDFVIENNSIVATYRSPDLALFPGQTSNDFVSLHSLRPDGFPFVATASAVVTLIGKSSATITPIPDQVFADGIQTSTITVTDILDANGNPVPDGEICALGASRGSIEGGTPNPAAGLRDFVIQDNMIVATYRAPDLNLFPGQTVIETIALLSIRPDGFPFATTATGRITLTGIQDVDNDGVPDPEDNCPHEFNPLQEDLDGDGLGDVCDPDDDSDGVPDIEDNCPIDPNPNQQDFDLDGMGNACDDVFGGDGIIADLESLILALRDLIVAVNPPGGNGMIAKLTGKGSVLSKAAGAVIDFGNETIDVDTYLDELDGALAMLDAFDLQLAAKLGNGQVPPVEGNEMQGLSGQVRGLLVSLKSAVGG